MDHSLMNANYRKIAAAEELQEQEYLLTVYRALYKNKYRNEPIFPIDNIHFKHIKDFRKLAGPRAQDLLEHYFRMADDWFQKQHYSLECLIKNINKVNTSYSGATKLQRTAGDIIIDFYCDSCWKPFKFSVPKTYDFDSLTRCETCTKDNLPARKIAKSERHGVILKLGSAFKDI